MLTSVLMFAGMVLTLVAANSLGLGDLGSIEKAIICIIPWLLLDVFGIIPGVRAFESYLNTFHTAHRHNSQYEFEDTGFEARSDNLVVYALSRVSGFGERNVISSVYQEGGEWCLLWFGRKNTFQLAFWATLEILINAHLIWVNEVCDSRGWDKIRLVGLHDDADGNGWVFVRLKVVRTRLTGRRNHPSDTWR